MVRWMSAAVMATKRVWRAPASRPGKRANLARSFPARHVILVNLHELDRLCHGLLLVPQLEDRVAADHLLGLHERTVDHAELAVGDAHLRTQCARHQRAAIEHVA